MSLRNTTSMIRMHVKWHAAAVYICAVSLFLSLNALLLVVCRYHYGLMVCPPCYYRAHSGREGVLAVIQWILKEHYQEGSVSEELLKEMLFWSCRYVHVCMHIPYCIALICM